MFSSGCYTIAQHLKWCRIFVNHIQSPNSSTFISSSAAFLCERSIFSSSALEWNPWEPIGAVGRFWHGCFRLFLCTCPRAVQWRWRRTSNLKDNFMHGYVDWGVEVEIDPPYTWLLLKYLSPCFECGHLPFNGCKRRLPFLAVFVFLSWSSVACQNLCLLQILNDNIVIECINATWCPVILHNYFGFNARLLVHKIHQTIANCRYRCY